MIILSVFAYANIFLLFIATTSVRELLNLPQFDLMINTSIPTIAITYAALIWVLHHAASKTYPKALADS